MSEQTQKLEFVLDTYPRETQDFNVLISSAPVGGKEGYKYFLDVVPDDSESKSIRYFAIEYQSPLREIENALREKTDMYSYLRRKGFTVPETVMYGANGLYSTLFVMSEITHGGRYLMWGYNDYPNPNEFSQLHKMNIGPDELKKIEELSLEWSTKATGDGVYLDMASYHVRKDLLTDAFDIAFLDIVPRRIGSVHNSENTVARSKFYESLQNALEYNQKIRL